jgi:hypothetical protein
MDELKLLKEYQQQIRFEMEKRSLMRLKAHVRVLVQFEYTSKIFETWSQDLNSEGVCLYGNGQLIYPGQHVKLTIFLPEVTLIGISGRVRWEEKTTKQRLAGVQFTNASASTQNKIREFGIDLCGTLFD